MRFFIGEFFPRVTERFIGNSCGSDGTLNHAFGESSSIAIYL
jgi:hypothetical protein